MSVDVSLCCNSEAQPPTERAHTDSFCSPQLKDVQQGRRQTIATLAAAATEAVAPMVCHQLEQLETAMRQILSEHGEQLSRVEATLQTVEHTVVSRCLLRGSIKGDKPEKSAKRRGDHSPAPPERQSDAAPDPATHSKPRHSIDRARSPQVVDRSFQAADRPPPIQIHQHVERARFKTGPARALLDASNGPAIREARSADPSPVRTERGETRAATFIASQGHDLKPPIERRRRRLSSPGVMSLSTLLDKVGSDQPQNGSVHEVPGSLPNQLPVAGNSSTRTPVPEDFNSLEANDGATGSPGLTVDIDPECSMQTSHTSASISVIKMPSNRERRPSADVRRPSISITPCPPEPSRTSESNGRVHIAPTGHEVHEEIAEALQALSASQSAGAAAALAALPATLTKEEPTKEDVVSIDYLLKKPECEEYTSQGCISNTTHVSQSPSNAPPSASEGEDKADPIRKPVRRSKSDTSLNPSAQEKKGKASKNKGPDSKQCSEKLDSPKAKKPVRRQKSEADAFRARFATCPATSSRDLDEHVETKLPPSASRRSSTERSVRTSSISPDKFFNDSTDRTSPQTHHFDLYSLEHLHSARLLELEVEELSPQHNGNPWNAVGSMLPMGNGRQDSPMIRQESSPKNRTRQNLNKGKVVPEAEPASASSPRRLKRQLSSDGHSIASSSCQNSETSEIYAGLDHKACTRNMDDLRRQHDHKLTSSELHHDDEHFMSSPENSETVPDSQQEEGKLQWKTRIALCICGVVPWQSRKISKWYQLVVLLIAALSAVFTIGQGLLHRSFVAEDDRDEDRTHEWRWYLGSLPFAVGSVIGLVIMRAGRVQKLVRLFPGPLEAYAYRHGFIDVWSHHASRRLTVLTSFWIMVMLVRLCSDVLLLETIDDTVWDQVLLLVCFIINSSIFLALITVQLYIFSILGMMVDQFCFKFFDCPDVSQGIQEWNVIQAILRHVTSAFDSCFLATQTSALTALLLSATQLLQFDLQRGTRETIGYITGVFLPPVLMAVGAGSLFFVAAEVTEKCSRVPALLNSVMCGGNDMLQHEKRHCIVQYVTHSAAGFYMKEVRLTSSMALKLTYITALGAYFVLTKIAADSSTISRL